MDSGGGGFYRNDEDVAREFQPANERPVVAPRPTVAPPPAPAGRPAMGQISGGFPHTHSFNYGNNSFQTEDFQAQGGGVGNVVPAVYPIPAGRDAARSGGASGTTLFVGDLPWWTTDAEIEAEVCKYGQVKEVTLFDDGLCGKSKGFCQVDFYDPIAAAACEEGMNGHLFNGRPCVVALASPHLVQTMGERQMNKNRQTTSAPEPPAPPQMGRGGGRPPVGNNFGGGGRWGRGGGMGNRGPVYAPPPPVLHPGAMHCQGFNPMGYGPAAMGGMDAGFRGSFAGAPGGGPFPGMMPPFPPTMAPHFNPAFFGWGSAPTGVGMWSASNIGGRGGQEQSSYGEASRGKSRMVERDSGRQKEMNWERDRERQRERNRDRDRAKEEKRRRSRSREVEHSKRRQQSP